MVLGSMSTAHQSYITLRDVMGRASGGQEREKRARGRADALLMGVLEGSAYDIRLC